VTQIILVINPHLIFDNQTFTIKQMEIAGVLIHSAVRMDLVAVLLAGQPVTDSDRILKLVPCAVRLLHQTIVVK
jgi:hypothetical protein